MSRTSRSHLAALPPSASRSACLKVFALVSALTRPRKVPPPQAVPPTRTETLGESTRTMETPEPMLTSMNGKSCSGHGSQAGSPSCGSTENSCPLRGPCSARKRRPSTTAASSPTVTTSMPKAAWKTEANLCAPPPATGSCPASRLRMLPEDASLSGKVRLSPRDSRETRRESPPRSSSPMLSSSESSLPCAMLLSASPSIAVAPEKKRRTQKESPSSHCSSSSSWQPLRAPECGQLSMCSSSGVASTSLATVPPMSRPLSAGEQKSVRSMAGLIDDLPGQRGKPRLCVGPSEEARTPAS
mmetsp:Transcript_44455/g.96678  ORF Transcript_44455/g.96678 Transcript_44455/m.96678 type:complete len:300 (+) Transcript_44455:521-1420(+)